MDMKPFTDFLELEHDGKLEEAKRQLLHLASQGHPLGLLELSRHYLQDDDPYTAGEDQKRSKLLADEAVQTLEELADCGDAEAMLHLARVFLGDYVPWYDSAETAENWLLKSFHAGCQSAANDLHRFYLARDRKKSEYWDQKT